ncbi:MAG: hypothetical protein ACR2H1_00310 [Limisphaerales bacterium]
MNPNARTARYHAIVAAEIETVNFRKPIWEESLQIAKGDQRAAEKIYFAKRVEQMERDEEFLETTHVAKIRRENFNDAVAPKRWVSKTLLLVFVVLVFVTLLFLLRLVK